MFEKEAEKYSKERAKKLGINELNIVYHAMLIAYQKGAEFGYNKANEWHYVKDKLPISDKDKFYFVVDKWNEPMIARFYEGVWSNYSVIEDVIAWKEIILPELKESE